jgi:flagellin
MMSILTNATSLASQKNLSNTQTRLSSNLQRLSSGLRIVTAADDAAGLGISERLKAQIRGFAQAERNSQDGISMTQVADGAMNEQAGVLIRLRELAVQSANGTLGTSDRDYIQAEANQLVAEIQAISERTEFNGVNTATLGVDALDYTSATGASAAIDALDTAIDSISTARSTIGAAQNRLMVTIQNLMTARENISAANSRIRDVDVAEESAAMTRNQILTQAGTAVLAQANQLPQSALSLLGGR